MKLTGDWTGVYDDDGAGDATPFKAALFDIGGVIWGTTEESGPAGTIIADLSGMRSGDEVRFTKVYRDAPKGFTDDVNYMGLVSAGGDRIQGRWEIGFAGVLGQGPFVMTRQGGQVEKLKLLAEAVVEEEL